MSAYKVTLAILLLAIAQPGLARISLRLPTFTCNSAPTYQSPNATLKLEKSAESPEVAFSRIHAQLTEDGWIPLSYARTTGLYQNRSKLCAVLTYQDADQNTQIIRIDKTGF